MVNVLNFNLRSIYFTFIFYGIFFVQRCGRDWLGGWMDGCVCEIEVYIIIFFYLSLLLIMLL